MPAPKFDEKTHPFVLRLPKSLFEKVRAAAKKEGVSINDYIAAIMIEKMKRFKTD